MPGYDSLMVHRCKTGSPCADSAPTRQAPSGAWLRAQISFNQAALTFLRRGAGLSETRAPTRLPGRPIAADRYGRIASQPRAAGGPIPVSDIWIAAQRWSTAPIR